MFTVYIFGKQYFNSFELRFPLDTKQVILETSFPANLLASTEETKPNMTKANIQPGHKNRPLP